MSVIAERLNQPFEAEDLEKTTEFYMRGGYDFPYPDPEIEAYRGREDIQYDIARGKAIELLNHKEASLNSTQVDNSIKTTCAPFSEPLVLHYAQSGLPEKSQELIEQKPEASRVHLIKYLSKIGTNRAARTEVAATYFQVASKVGQVLGTVLIEGYESHLPANQRLKSRND